MQKFLSRKLLVALGVILLEFLKGYHLSLPPQSEQVILSVSLAYLGGQSLIDAIQAYKTPS